MPLQIVRNDITRMKVDAIVNAANERLEGGGGVDGAIHRAAGPGLAEACRKIGGCPVGEARVTPGFALRCRYVIHTVGPVWEGGDRGESDLLRACYRSSLREAAALGCETVAFPLISAGTYGYPRDAALRVASDTIRAFLESREDDMLVFLVVYDRASFDIGRELFSDIRAWIDDSAVPPVSGSEQRRRRAIQSKRPSNAPDTREEALHILEEAFDARIRENRGIFGAPFRPDRDRTDTPDMGPAAPPPRPAAAPSGTPEPAKAKKPGGLSSLFPPAAPPETPEPAKAKKPGGLSGLFHPAAPAETSLDRYLEMQDEGFRDMLLRKIDERGLTDAECYKRANVDRKLFNKIKNQPDYHPGKYTVLALAISLRLPMPELREMLMKAGFSLTRSSKADLIVEYFLLQGRYDVFEINEALFAFDQRLLGSAL